MLRLLNVEIITNLSSHCTLKTFGRSLRMGVEPTIQCTSPLLGRGIDIIRAIPVTMTTDNVLYDVYSVTKHLKF